MPSVDLVTEHKPQPPFQEVSILTNRTIESGTKAKDLGYTRPSWVIATAPVYYAGVQDLRRGFFRFGFLIVSHRSFTILP